jgi:hypothetical protein
MRYAEGAELLLEKRWVVLASLEWDRDPWNKHALHIHQAETTTHPPTPCRLIIYNELGVLLGNYC